MTTMSVSEARAALPEVLDRVAAGEEVTITRHGSPVAVVVRPDVLRARRAGPALDVAADVHTRLEAARQRPLPKPSMTSRRAAALAREVRAGRDRG